VLVLEQLLIELGVVGAVPLIDGGLVHLAHSIIQIITVVILKDIDADPY
jgi:hypothetical protein